MTHYKPDRVDILLADWLEYEKEGDSFFRLGYAICQAITAAMAEERENYQTIDIIFDGPPSHEAGRFVEVETEDGKSINAGEWIKRPNGYWVLRLTAAIRKEVKG